MSFLGKRIRDLDKAESLLDDAYFIVDNGNDEANKVSVATTRDYIITPDKVAGSTVEIQMVINEGKKQLVQALAENGVDASIFETFPQLETKVAALIVDGDKTFSDVPWIHGHDTVDVSLFPFTTAPVYSDKLNVFFVPSDNGVCSVYKSKQSTSGAWIPTLVAKTESGSWTTVFSYLSDGIPGFADDGSFIFVSDVTYSDSTGRCFNINVVRYNEADNAITTETHYVSGLSYTGYYNHLISIIGESPDKKYIYFGTYADKCIIVLDKDNNTVHKSAYYGDYFNISDTCKSVFVSNNKLVAATRGYVYTVEFSGDAVKLSGIQRINPSTDTIIYDDVKNAFIFITDSAQKYTDLRSSATIFDINSYTLAYGPKIINHDDFRYYNVYPVSNGKNIVSIQKIELADNLLYINPINNLYNACIYHRDTNTLEFPYITGFGSGSPWDGSITISHGTEYSYIDPETKTGTCILATAGSYGGYAYNSCNYTLHTQVKNQVEYVNNGNIYTLDTPYE